MADVQRARGGRRRGVDGVQAVAAGIGPVESVGADRFPVLGPLGFEAFEGGLVGNLRVRHMASESGEL